MRNRQPLSEEMVDAILFETNSVTLEKQAESSLSTSQSTDFATQNRASVSELSFLISFSTEF